MSVYERRVSVGLGTFFLAMVLCAVVMMVTGCGEVVSGAGAASDVDTKVSDAKDEQDDREFLEKVYREFAAELTPHDKKNPAGDYIAIVDAGMPVLLVTDSIIGGDTGNRKST